MKKILIIEDDADTADILILALAKRYRLSMINNTINLMEKMNDFLPDLIITDNFVGQKVAAEIIKEIRSEDRFSHIPVILFSAHPDIHKLSIEIAAAAYINKPFTLQYLNSSIEKVLASPAVMKEVTGNINA